MACDIESLNHELTHTAKDGRISCAAALNISVRSHCSTATVGDALDTLGIRIELCQLGLFGYGADKQKKILVPDEIPADVTQWIEAKNAENGHVTCAEIFEMSKEQHRSRALVAGACEKMGIKIRKCQIGAFA